MYLFMYTYVSICMHICSYIHIYIYRYTYIYIQSDEEPIHPLDIIIDAWNQTCREKVTGSSTICVATLDNKLNQLSYSNLGKYPHRTLYILYIEFEANI
jgi:hypothetical protein